MERQQLSVSEVETLLHQALRLGPDDTVSLTHDQYKDWYGGEIVVLCELGAEVIRHPPPPPVVHLCRFTCPGCAAPLETRMGGVSVRWLKASIAHVRCPRCETDMEGSLEILS